MKALLSLVIGIQMMGLVAMAQAVVTPKPDVVIEVLKSSQRTVDFKVESDSYNQNINGYACDWPGLDIPRYILDVDLNHEGGFSFSGNGYNIAIGVKNPNYAYCGRREAKEVFGEEFVVGAILPMTITQVLEVRLIDRWHGKQKKYLVETITVELNQRALETTAFVDLPK